MICIITLFNFVLGILMISNLEKKMKQLAKVPKHTTFSLTTVDHAHMCDYHSTPLLGNGNDGELVFLLGLRGLTWLSHELMCFSGSMS